MTRRERLKSWRGGGTTSRRRFQAARTQSRHSKSLCPSPRAHINRSTPVVLSLPSKSRQATDESSTGQVEEPYSRSFGTGLDRANRWGGPHIATRIGLRRPRKTASRSPRTETRARVTLSVTSLGHYE